MRVQHIMSLNPVACEVDDSCAHAARLMRDRAVGCVVVLRGGRVAGLATDRMLATSCLAEALDPEATPIAQVMVRDPALLSPDDSIFAACDTMRSAGLARRIPVVGPGRELLGLVSIADLAVVAKDLLDAVLAEDLQHTMKRTRALTGGKRIAKRIRRPTKADRLPETPIVPKRRRSREGLVQDVVPRRLRRRRGRGRQERAGLPPPVEETPDVY